MRLKKRNCINLLILGSSLFFNVCNKNPVNALRIPDVGRTNNGYFNLIIPMSGDTARIGDKMTIMWSSKKPDSSKIMISLYNKSQRSAVICSSCTNSGAYSWDVPNCGSGTEYRIKLCLLPDSQHYDFGPYFTIYSGYEGKLSIVNPGTSDTPLLDSIFTIKWTFTGSPGPRLNLILYKDTDSVQHIIDGIATGLRSYPWDPVKSLFGSGKKYRIKALSEADAAIFAWSDYFSITSHFSGNITVKSPQDSMIWKAGFPYKITWDTTGNLGANVNLELYNGQLYVMTISTEAPNNGNYNWNIPEYMTSGNYRIKVVCRSDPAIYAFSPVFILNGIDPDEFETDNTLEQASALVLGQAQHHTVTLNDTDWTSFSTDSGEVYFIQDSTAGSYRSSIQVFRKTEPSPVFSCTTAVSGLLSVLWTSPGKSNWYARLTPYLNGSTGRHSFRISRFDPSLVVSFINPSTDFSISSGETIEINWKADSGFLGKSVELYLYNNAYRILPATRSASPNSGSYQWTIPEGLATGDGYRIGIVNSSDSRYYGLSGYFTIRGFDPDPFEYDNARDSASSFPTGSVQMRNLSLNDSDWISFKGDSSSQYVIHCQSTPECRVTLSFFNKSETSPLFSYQPDSTGSIIKIWRCTGSGLYYVLAKAINSSTWGNYSLRISRFDPDTSIKISQPSFGTDWLTGSIHTIRWTPDSILLGNSVILTLYRNTSPVSTLITDAVPDNGTFNWTIPGSLTADDRYRIRIAGSLSPDIFGYSRYFTINRFAADSFEIDNSLGQPSIIKEGVVQDRTITYNDTDFVRFEAPGIGQYLFAIAGSGVTANLYDTSMTIPGAVSQTNGSNISTLLLWTCNKELTSFTRITPSVSSYSGAYDLTVRKWDTLSSASFTAPVAGSAWNADSTCIITWTPDTVVFSKEVTLSFYKGNNELSSSRGLPNSGSFLWKIPAAYATGDDYRIKMTNNSRSAIYGWSDLFTIKGMPPDTFETDNQRSQASVLVSGKAQKHSITYNDTDWVKFTAESGNMYILEDSGRGAFKTSLYLYGENDQTPVASKTTDNSGTLKWLWTCGNSGTYYLQIHPGTSGTLGEYIIKTTRFDTLSSLVITSPPKDTLVTAGTALTVRWFPDSTLLERLVNISLCKEFRTIAEFSITFESNSGVYTWTVPSSMASGDNYRIKIVNHTNAKVYGYGSPFSIEGIASDPYEPDDSRGQAASIISGVEQKHNITYNDIDWVKIYADSGSTFVFQNTSISGFTTKLCIYDENDASGASCSNSGAFGETYRLWTFKKSGTYYCSTTPYTSGTTGEYSMKVTKFDTLSSIVFTNPTGGETFTTGSSVTVSWVPDSSLLGANASVKLCRNFREIGSVVNAIIANNGSRSWTVPRNLLSGNDYRIKIVNYENRSIYGYSLPFSVSGTMTPDSYEPDDIRTQATPLAAGATQLHNLTFGDTDWVSISAQSGVKYIIRDKYNTEIYNRKFTVNAAVFYENEQTNTAEDRQSLDPLFIWSCATGGTYYIRISSTYPDSSNTYPIFFTPYDSSAIISFTSPLPGSTYNSGETVDIQWACDTSLFTGTVNIYLLMVNRQVKSISTANDGSYSFALPENMTKGSTYRFRIDGPQVTGYSGYFTVNGSDVSEDTYEPDNTFDQAKTLVPGASGQIHNFIYNDIDWVKFQGDSSCAYSITGSGELGSTNMIFLYYNNNTSQVNFSSFHSGGKMHGLLKCIKSGTYYMSMRPLVTSGVYDYTVSLTKFDSFPTINIPNPSATTIWTPKTSPAVTWTADTSIFGNNLNLSFYKGNSRISRTAVTNTGNYNLSIPAGLLSGNDYRITITASYDSLLGGESRNFSVNGMTPDSYEPDNKLQSAIPIISGVPQIHNLTFNDTDLVTFTADSGVHYDITSVTYMSGLAVVLYYQDLSHKVFSFDAYYSDTLISSWQMEKTGTFYLLMRAAYFGTETAYTGNYSIEVKKRE
jgi:hypothetical protein